MPILGTARLLGFARGLQRATSFAELLSAVRDEVVDALGYRHVWFFVADDDAATELRIIDAAGASRDANFEFAHKLTVSGDPFLEEVVASDDPVIIVDARTDPRTNKEIVHKIGNRTIVNVPLRLLDKPFGVLGIGTFGDEGCRVPTPQQLEYLVAMAAQVAVAAGRIRYQEMKASADAEKLAYERRLLQSEKLESLGMLAGGIAHDFNNLLTVILSGAELAQLSVIDGTGREELQAVIDAALRARALSRQLVAMSRSQALDLQPMDVDVRLAELLGLLRRLLPSTVTIELSHGEGDLLVECDASQFDQVILNLCVNARDAMPEGGLIRIGTTIAEVDAARGSVEPGRYALLTMTDNGTGMAPATAERIFEPFFSTKAPGKGSGLGLAVSYGIIRQHEGSLLCSSELGRGTTFEIYLPLLADAARRRAVLVAAAPEVAGV